MASADVDDSPDSDAISLTSTVEEDTEDNLYTVESILAENIQRDGSLLYLIKWAGYPVADATWEPFEHIKDTDLPEIWEKERKARGGSFNAYCLHNIETWEVAVEKKVASKERRQAKRAAKRKNLATQKVARKVPLDVSDDDDDDIPLVSKIRAARLQRIAREQSEDVSPLFVEDTQTLRKSTVEQPSSFSPKGKGSGGSLVEESNTTQNHRSPKPRTKTPAKQQNTPSQPTRPTNLSGNIARASTSDSRHDNLPTSPNDGGHPIPISRRTSAGVAPPIKMVNEPQHAFNKRRAAGTQESRGAPLASEAHYSTVSMRRRAEVRGRNESTPDLNELVFPGGAPAGIPKLQPPTRNPGENPYGRRETGRPRIHEQSEDSAQHHQDDSSNRIDLEADKVPLTCFEWRNGSCQYSAENCRFLHRDTSRLAPVSGIVPPKYRKPPLTCFWWMEGIHGCKHSEEDCDFAHWNTGMIRTNDGSDHAIDPARNPRFRPHSRDMKFRDPSQLTCYFWANGGCNHLAEMCKYRHFDTGTVAEPPGWLREKEKGERQERKIAHGRTSRLAASLTRQSDPKGQPDPWINEDAGSFGEAIGTDSASVRTPPSLAQELPCRTLAPVPAEVSAAEMERTIGMACKLDLVDMFSYNVRDTEHPRGLMDRRAFLIFHPADDAQVLELITRWLLLHSVEVFPVWIEGAWDDFRKAIFDGGTGIILAHPDYDAWWDVPEFGQVLRTEVRIFQVGWNYPTYHDPQISQCFKEDRDRTDDRWDCIEIFTHGGIIYITDEVFEEKPNEAAKLFELFIAKVDRCRQVYGPTYSGKLVDDGLLTWRLATKPELMGTTMDWLIEHEDEVEASHPNSGPQSRARLYSMLDECGYIEQDDTSPYAEKHVDYYPIISEKRSVSGHYYEARACSQAKANEVHVRQYMETVVWLNRWYRQFLVVHTKPSEVDWGDKMQTIGEIMTPEKCIEYLEQTGSSDQNKRVLIDFWEWMFGEKTVEDMPTKFGGMGGGTSTS